MHIYSESGRFRSPNRPSPTRPRAPSSGERAPAQARMARRRTVRLDLLKATGARAAATKRAAAAAAHASGGWSRRVAAARWACTRIALRQAHGRTALLPVLHRLAVDCLHVSCACATKNAWHICAATGLAAAATSAPRPGSGRVGGNWVGAWAARRWIDLGTLRHRGAGVTAGTSSARPTGAAHDVSIADSGDRPHPAVRRSPVRRSPPCAGVRQPALARAYSSCQYRYR